MQKKYILRKKVLLDRFEHAKKRERKSEKERVLSHYDWLDKTSNMAFVAIIANAITRAITSNFKTFYNHNHLTYWLLNIIYYL